MNKIYNVKSPLLLIIFNRPETTKKVFEVIKLTKPKKIYVAADGPRENNENDAVACLEARSIIEQIDWECEIKTLFREKNIGCKEGVSGAINWFFENENEGIILEDDCLPCLDFFIFMDLMLNKYRDDDRISHITGCNLQKGVRTGSASYYFSSLTHIWGWGTWKRVWIEYDKELDNFEIEDAEIAFNNIFENKMIFENWFEIFKDMKNKKIDTWDFQFAILNFFNNRLSVVPNVNLISNIGYNKNATHTVDENDPYSKIPLMNLDENFIYPKITLSDKNADFEKCKYDFRIEERLKHLKRQKSNYKRFKRFFRNLFNITKHE